MSSVTVLLLGVRMQSLSGHTSAVECVTFDSNEQTVIAGSAGGTLKLWDLEQAKVARTLTGHRSNCVSVQVHCRAASVCTLLCSSRHVFSRVLSSLLLHILLTFTPGLFA